MKIYQSATLSANPSQPMEAVTKQYVDQQTATGGQAPVFITDITQVSAGSVGGKTYVAGTIPANKVITSAITNTQNVRVTVIAEGPGNFYSPTITVTNDKGYIMSPASGIIVLTEDANDKRYFTGYVDLAGVAENTVVTVTSSTGSVATATIAVAVAGPAFTSLTLGVNPGTQTELKSGDVIAVTGVVANSAVAAETVAGGVVDSIQTLTLGASNSAGAGFKTVSGNITIGSGTGAALTLTVRARDALPTWGANFVSTNTKTLNQTGPSIGAISVAYPAGQTALKGSETATVTSNVTVASGTLAVTYTSTDSNVSIDTPTAYASSKTVTRIAGSYVYGTNNYRIDATRVENGKTATLSAAVNIVNVAAVATFSYGAARLISSAAGTNTSVSISSTQNLPSVPTNSITPSSGTMTTAWSGSGTSFSNNIKVYDTDPKGVQSLSATAALVGRSGIAVTLANASYTVGGFAVRTITVPAFARIVPIGTSVTNISKTVVNYTGSTVLTLHNDVGDYFQGYSVCDVAGTYSATGSYIWLSDAAFAGSNTTGSLQIDVQESV